MVLHVFSERINNTLIGHIRKKNFMQVIDCQVFNAVAWGPCFMQAWISFGQIFSIEENPHLSWLTKDINSYEWLTVVSVHMVA